MWNNRTFWRWVELVAGVAATASGVLVVLDLRALGATLASVCGALILLARRRLEAIDAARREMQASLVQRILRRLLVALDEQYFGKAPAVERHLHRVTLFVCRDADASVGKRLEVYARVGVFERSATSLAVDADHKDACEGVAGQVWFMAAKLTLGSLPEWPSDPSDIAGQDAHARAGYLSREKAACLNVKSRALSGAVVEVNERKWGVLLLDSQAPGLIREKKERIITQAADLIGKMLRESEK